MIMEFSILHNSPCCEKAHARPQMVPQFLLTLSFAEDQGSERTGNASDSSLHGLMALAGIK